MRMTTRTTTSTTTTSVVIMTTTMMMTTMTTRTPFLMTGVDAACSGTAGSSSSSPNLSTQSCTGCLSTEGCNAWIPSLADGNGECFPTCMDGPADVACFTNMTLVGTDSTVDDVCTLAETSQADAIKCSNEGGGSCETCTSVVLSDEINTCRWFPSANNDGSSSGSCSSECGLEGCGTVTCDNMNGNGSSAAGGSTSGNETDCVAIPTCTECMESGCGWIGSSSGCIESCSIIADVACYDVTTFPTLNETETCDAVSVIEADSNLCDQQTTCTSCVTTSLLSNSSLTCQWNEQFDFCSSRSTMAGPGTFVCIDTSSPSPDPPLTCENSSESCEECLGNSCAWAPVAGCLPSCDVIADTSCYALDTTSSSSARQAGGESTPESICAVAANNTADAELCDSLMDCTSCVTAVLSDGQSTCKWYGTYCNSLTCGMDECGSTTCDGDVGSDVPSNAPSSLLSTPITLLVSATMLSSFVVLSIGDMI